MKKATLLKLVSGEDVIAKIHETEKGYKLKDAIKILYSTIDVRMMPLHPFIVEEEEIEILKEHVIYKGFVTEEMNQVYIKQIQTGFFEEPSVEFNVVEPDEDE